MKCCLFILTLAALLAGCGAPAAGPPTPVVYLPLKTTPYPLGNWPNAGGPFVVMSYVDGPRDSSGVRILIRNGTAYQDPVVQAQDGLFALVRYAAKKNAVDLDLAKKEAAHLNYVPYDECRDW